MIARFRVRLPFSFLVPAKLTFPEIDTAMAGYRVVLRGPLQSRKPTSNETAAAVPVVVIGEEIIPANPPRILDQVSIDGREAFQADLIQLDFHKADFNRQNAVRNSPTDPPEELAFKIVNSLLRRLRSVSQAPHAFEISSANAPWTIDYVSDGEDPLPANTGISSRTNTPWQFQDQSITGEIWEMANSLPFDYEPPRWDTLLLDAQQLLPQLGPALVLAATAVETIASAVIDYLFSKSAVPQRLHEWITDRGDWRKDPSVEEQCDILLKSLSGQSLKEQPKLWEVFRNLKTARNNFVHEGVAAINKTPATLQSASLLIEQTSNVVSFLEGFLDDSRKRRIANKPIVKLPPYLAGR